LILRLPQQNEQCKDGEGQEPDDDRKEHPSFEKLRRTYEARYG
jgi:hypothetical protein